MSYTINFDNTPSSLLLPPGYYDVLLYQIEEAWSQNSGIRMYRIALRIEAPNAYAEGRFHDENLLFGKRPWNRTPNPDRRPDPDYDAYAALDDPNGEQALSWRYSSGIRLFADICRVTGHDLNGTVDMDQLILKLANSALRFGCELRQRKGTDDRVRTEIAQVYKLGEHAPRVSTAPAGMPPAAAARGAANGGERSAATTLPANAVAERRRDRQAAASVD